MHCGIAGEDVKGVILMREFLNQGGPVLWVILGLGAAAFVTFVERGFHVHRARIMADDFVSGILNILRRKNVEEALTICEETPGPVARLVKTAVLHRESEREFLESAVNEAGLSEIARLESRAGVIATVGHIAPLFGLLGTVIGLMTLLGEVEGTHWQARRVAEGLRAALITTGAGLTVAVLCYASYNLVVAKIEALVVDMERASSSVLAFLTSSKS